MSASPPSLLIDAQTRQRLLNEQLILACRSRSEAEVEKALGQGADPNWQNAMGWMPLTACADPILGAPSAAPIATKLLEAGALPNAQSRRPLGPQAALHLAACALDLGLASALLAAGADANARDKSGRSAMHLLGARRQQPDPALDVALAQQLLDAGAILDLPDCQRATPLLLAIERRSEALSLFLAQRGARLGALCKSASPALHRAAEMGQLRLCEGLIALGADPFEIRDRRDAFRLARDCSPPIEQALRALWEAQELQSHAQPASAAPSARPRL